MPWELNNNTFDVKKKCEAPIDKHHGVCGSFSFFYELYKKLVVL